MTHQIEPAPSARSKCRGCGERIAAGVLRFGEILPNPFAEGETMTHWFHLDCAALKRPESVLAALAVRAEPLEGAEQLEADARLGVAHPRLARVNGAERSPTGRAVCRACKQTIAKDAWRIVMVFYENERFVPAGFLHASCALKYVEVEAAQLLSRVRRFSPGLGEQELQELQAALQSA